MRKIYMVNDNIDHLLLLSGDLVINGGYYVTWHKDGTVSVPRNDNKFKFTFVMNADYKSGDDKYNAVLQRAKEYLMNWCDYII